MDNEKLKEIHCTLDRDLGYIVCKKENMEPFGRFDGEYDYVDFFEPNSAFLSNILHGGISLRAPYCFDYIPLEGIRALQCCSSKSSADEIASDYTEKKDVHKYY